MKVGRCFSCNRPIRERDRRPTDRPIPHTRLDEYTTDGACRFCAPTEADQPVTRELAS